MAHPTQSLCTLRARRRRRPRNTRYRAPATAYPDRSLTGRTTPAFLAHKQPHSVVMLFTGMAFWIMLGIALYKAFRQRSSQPEPAAFPSVALMAQRHGNRPAREH